MLKIFFIIFVSLNYAQSQPAHFSPSYQELHLGVFKTETPEVRELINIIFAISPEGIAGHPLTLHKILDSKDPLIRQYYKDVLSVFLPYSNHTIVSQFNEILKKPTAKASYPYFNLNSYGLVFKDNKIIADGIHNYFWSKDKNHLADFITELEDFSKKTNFRAFYKKNKSFYAQLEKRFADAVPVKKQWLWLEKRFDDRISSYKILISPLVYGFHCTGSMSHNHFSEIVMSISAPDLEIKNFQLERVIFTEIDHNYVNPTSDQFKKEIQLALSNKKKWASQQSLNSYTTELEIFNEYMTWGVFLLYARDTYPRHEFKEIKDQVIDKMKNQRGFLKFDQLSDELMRQYKIKEETKIIKYYPHMINWMKKQNSMNL